MGSFYLQNSSARLLPPWRRIVNMLQLTQLNRLWKLIKNLTWINVYIPISLLLFYPWNVFRWRQALLYLTSRCIYCAYKKNYSYTWLWSMFGLERAEGDWKRSLYCSELLMVHSGGYDDDNNDGFTCYFCLPLLLLFYQGKYSYTKYNCIALVNGFRFIFTVIWRTHRNCLVSQNYKKIYGDLHESSQPTHGSSVQLVTYHLSFPSVKICNLHFLFFFICIKFTYT